MTQNKPEDKTRESWEKEFVNIAKLELIEVIDGVESKIEAPKEYYRSLIIYVRNLLSQSRKEVLEEERKRIFGAFLLAGSALTMYQDDTGILWTAEELRKEMVKICKIETKL